MENLIKIARNSLVVWGAALCLAVGIGMIGYSAISSPPTRDSLQTAEGMISGASRVTRTSKRTRTTTSYYEMTLKLGTGTSDIKLRVPTIEIAESEVRALIGRVVKAEFDSEQDVYVLSQGGRELLTYTNSLVRRNLNLRQYHVDGIALVIAGIVLGVVGFFFGLRKLRKEAADGVSPSQE